MGPRDQKLNPRSRTQHSTRCQDRHWTAEVTKARGAQRRTHRGTIAVIRYCIRYPFSLILLLLVLLSLTIMMFLPSHQNLLTPKLHTYSPKPHLLQPLHRSFPQNRKHCFFTNPIPIPSRSLTSLIGSTLNTIQLIRLNICLPACLPDSGFT